MPNCNFFLTQHTGHFAYAGLMAVLLFFQLSINGCACRKSDAPQTISLALNESHSICKKRHLRLDSITSDSRCPTGVQCFWEGNAELHFTLSIKKDLYSINLNTSPQFIQDTMIGGVHISLDSLTPYPTAGNQILSENYRCYISTRRER